MKPTPYQRKVILMLGEGWEISEYRQATARSRKPSELSLRRGMETSTISATAFVAFKAYGLIAGEVVRSLGHRTVYRLTEKGQELYKTLAESPQ